jgi:[ribosomal protein S18]-alanine N-acetyltransferase
MSALARPSTTSVLLPMAPAMLDEVLAIENAVYDFPWTRGNFLDSMSAGYSLQVLAADATPGTPIVGYYIAMPGVDELHLLNLSVAPSAQRSGHALFMLEALRAQAVALRAPRLWLEVRVSNERARRIYEQFGFVNCGLRRHYYPARGTGREDAVVMSLALPEVLHGLG